MNVKDCPCVKTQKPVPPCDVRCSHFGFGKHGRCKQCGRSMKKAPALDGLRRSGLAQMEYALQKLLFTRFRGEYREPIPDGRYTRHDSEGGGG